MLRPESRRRPRIALSVIALFLTLGCLRDFGARDVDGSSSGEGGAGAGGRAGTPLNSEPGPSSPDAGAGGVGENRGGSAGSGSGGMALAGQSSISGAGGEHENPNSAGAGGADATNKTYALNEQFYPPLQWHGSTRGGVDFELLCAANEVMVGANVAFVPVTHVDPPDNEVPARLSVRCATLNADGTLSNVRSTPPTARNAAAKNEVTEECPPGSVVTRIKVITTGSEVNVLYVVAVRFDCAPLKDWMNRIDAAKPGTLLGMEVGQAAAVDVCAAGWVMKGISGRNYDLVDAIQGRCVQVTSQQVGP